MAATNTGGWVRRVGAAGGGKTYRRRRPVNYYGLLGLLVVVGLFSVGFARYDYRKPKPTLGPPVVSALGIETCGTLVPSLPTDPVAAPTGYQLLDNNVIAFKPLTLAQASAPGVLSSFASSYVGLTISTKKLVVPIGNKGHTSTHTTGDKCPRGTKYAGRVGHVEIATWSNLISTTPSFVTTDPAKVDLTNGQILTVAFVPKGVTPLRPRPIVTSSMEAQKAYILQHGSVSTTTTTFKPPVTTTTQKHSHKG